MSEPERVTEDLYLLEPMSIAVPPKQLGGYDIGNITLMLTRRPHWVARFLCRLLLDWRWVDAS